MSFLLSLSYLLPLFFLYPAEVPPLMSRVLLEVSELFLATVFGEKKFFFSPARTVFIYLFFYLPFFFD